MIRHIHQAHDIIMSHPVIKIVDKHLRRNIVAWFTLIEVLIVTTVVWVLATATTTRITNQQESSRNISRKTMVWQLASTITTFYSNNRYRPNTLGSLANYVSTTPIDPKKLDTCHTSATANGQYGYLRYENGWLSGDKDGFMLFSQLERGWKWIDYTKIYVLTWSDPCQNSATWDPTLVDRYMIANSVCTSKPWWTENNPARTGPLALNSFQQDLVDIFGNRKAYALYAGTWARTQPWIGTWASDLDGDQIANTSEPNTAARTNPCIPSQYARNCDYDTDDDGIYDPAEWNNSDTDSDGMPDYMEKVNIDTDGDGVVDQYDNGRPSCNGRAATIYISPIINSNQYIIGWSSNLSVYGWTIPEANGGAVIVWSDGNDTINGWNGDDTICGWAGNDTINGWNASDDYDCGGWTDVTVDSNGTDTCSINCENRTWCNGTWLTITGITYPPSANTVTCSSIVTPISGDGDGDSYVNVTWVASNYGNADSNDSNACLPNSLTYACSPKSTFPGGTCDDNDNDVYKNNIYRTLSYRDPNDQDPCNPNPYSTSCITYLNTDIDEDGYRPYSTGSLYDPDDNDKCNPRVFREWCTRDTDGDGKTDYQEWELTNTDTFFGYPLTLGFDIYSGAYATILNQWWLTVLVSWDNLYNWQEADRNTVIYPNSDPDWDWVFNELDPVNNNSCIPSNFGTGCGLDFDGDGVLDWQEGSAANTDATWWYVSDAYPNWIEALIGAASTYLWLTNPSGLNPDPDLDGITNQLDPNNSNICIPNTGADASCVSTPPPPPPSAIQWVDCASMTSLPPGARVYYVHVY